MQLIQDLSQIRIIPYLPILDPATYSPPCRMTLKQLYWYKDRRKPRKDVQRQIQVFSNSSNYVNIDHHCDGFPDPHPPPPPPTHSTPQQPPIPHPQCRIYASANRVSTGSDNGLSPIQWNLIQNTRLLIHESALENAKRRPLCSGEDGLNTPMTPAPWDGFKIKEVAMTSYVMVSHIPEISYTW